MIARIFQQEDLNFLLTNRIPRRWATLFSGWLSRLESPLVVGASLRIWKLFAPDLDLSEARTTRFRSLRECFIRELAPGARPVVADPDVIVSPCDAIVGACGRVDDEVVIQAKGLPYTLKDLLGGRCARGAPPQRPLRHAAPALDHVSPLPRPGRLPGARGDVHRRRTWNVNPIALERVERLFCRNERAVLPLELEELDGALTLVPVAAIGVASLRLHCLGATLGLRYAGRRGSPATPATRRARSSAGSSRARRSSCWRSGDLALADGVREGRTLRVGQPLLVTSNDPRET